MAPAKPTNPCHFFLQFSLSFHNLVPFHFIIFCYPLSLPCCQFLFPQCKGISAGIIHIMWWTWGGIQRSLELGGPQAEQCVTARAWQGLQPWGVGRAGSGRQRVVGMPGTCQRRRPKVGARKTLEFGREILAGHFLSKLQDL